MMHHNVLAQVKPPSYQLHMHVTAYGEPMPHIHPVCKGSMGPKGGFIILNGALSLVTSSKGGLMSYTDIVVHEERSMTSPVNSMC